MAKRRLPKSLRKFIRKEKARIRREVFNVEEQDGLINKLYQQIVKDNKTGKERRIEEKIKDEK